MAKKTSKPTTEALPPQTNEVPDLAKKPIIIQDNTVTVYQLYRGNQDIASWYQAVKTAELLRNPNRRYLLNTYVDITIDLHLTAMMEKRIRAVKTVPFEWDGLVNDAVKENFKAPWFIETIKHIMSSIFWGTTLIEFETGEDGLIAESELVPRQNVKPEFGIISVDGFSQQGIPYREGIYQNYLLEVGHKRDLGLLAKLAPYVLMKRMNLADFSRYNEMFGHDLRVYYYDPSKPDAKAKVEASAKDYGTAAYIVLPQNYGNVDFKASNKQSSAAMYKELHDILNDEITIGILGQTLTTSVNSKGGSRALGDVHKDVEGSINMEDRLMCEYVLNYPFKKNILIPHGYPMDGVKGAFKLTEEVDIETKQTMWMDLIDRGFPIASEDIYAEFGIPDPADRPIFIKTPTAPPAPDPADPTDPKQTDPNNEDPNSQPGGAGKKKPQGEKLSAKLQKLYARQCPVCSGSNLSTRGIITLGYKDDLSEVIDAIIAKMKQGDLKPGSVDPDLYELIGSRLFDAVERGYGTTIDAGAQVAKDTLMALRDNVYRFSAFKTYHFIQEANTLLKNEDGTLKSFADFKKDILQLSKEYNINLLRTEYNQARAASRMAQKWQQFKTDQAALPLLQYVTVGDGRVRKAHQALNGITRPVNDAFWKSPASHLPPLDWNCRCTVKQLAAGDITDVNFEKLPEIKKGFGYNWGEEKFVFPPDHPQFTVNPGDIQSANDNFDLPLPS
jgi:SPP1 gp7 family putative phage head morphogenesis protein